MCLFHKWEYIDSVKIPFVTWLLKRTCSKCGKVQELRGNYASTYWKTIRKG